MLNTNESSIWIMSQRRVTREKSAQVSAEEGILLPKIYRVVDIDSYIEMVLESVCKHNQFVYT